VVGWCSLANCASIAPSIRRMSEIRRSTAIFFQHCDRLSYIRRFEYLKPLAPKSCRLEHSFEDIVFHEQDDW
jgi:hypothetical protein